MKHLWALPQTILGQKLKPLYTYLFVQTFPGQLKSIISQMRHTGCPIKHKIGCYQKYEKILIYFLCGHLIMQAISAREQALCQLTVCFEFQSRSERRSQRLCLANGIQK